jgi:hypothetical protein
MRAMPVDILWGDRNPGPQWALDAQLGVLPGLAQGLEYIFHDSLYLP